MSRLDDIKRRNRSGGYQLKHNWEFGLRSLFLLLILGLLAFTKWATPPPDHRPGIEIVPGPQDAAKMRPRPTGGTTMMRAPRRPAATAPQAGVRP